MSDNPFIYGFIKHCGFTEVDKFIMPKVFNLLNQNELEKNINYYQIVLY